MKGNHHALVTSSFLESRRVLLRMLEGLKVNTFASATLAEAEEVFPTRSCVSFLRRSFRPDGTYRDLLKALRTWKKTPHIVVTTRIGEWKDYLEALGLGASDMIPYPFRSTDVELDVLRAMRGRDQSSDGAFA